VIEKYSIAQLTLPSIIVEDLCYSLACEKYQNTFVKNKNLPPLDLEVVKSIMTNHWTNARKGKPHGNPSAGQVQDKIIIGDPLKKLCLSEGLTYNPDWTVRLQASGLVSPSTHIILIC
jgi:hypothetical protein